MKKCAVIGSINMDLVVKVPHFPQPGETLMGSHFDTVPGGKGANQAIALARLGVPVKMVGMVGCDDLGKRYLDHFKAEHVDISCVSRTPCASTGIADILINAQGENFIAVVPGANALCDKRWLDTVIDQVADCDIFLLQLELPLSTVEACASRLHAMGKIVILDPAPAVPLSQALLNSADYLTPNETELCILTHSLPQSASVGERTAALIGDSDRTLIHKRGGDGAYIVTKNTMTHMPGYPVDVVDTTAAGDTFNAGLAAGLSMGLSLADSVRMANAAGALAVTALGAQSGMPTLERLTAFMAEQPQRPDEP